MSERFRMQRGPDVDEVAARQAYYLYACCYGTSQSFERIQERGGLSWAEVEDCWKRVSQFGRHSYRTKAEIAESFREIEESHGHRSQAAEIEHLTTAMHNVKFDLERLIEKHAVAVLHAEAAEKELADIKRQAEDATEYVLAGMLREERARAESLEADRGSYKRTANQLAERVAAAEKERDELRRLLGIAADVLTLPGHAFSPDDWEQACLLTGRYCEPFWP